MKTIKVNGLPWETRERSVEKLFLKVSLKLRNRCPANSFTMTDLLLQNFIVMD